jgi:hypothetical protein
VSFQLGNASLIVVISVQPANSKYYLGRYRLSAADRLKKSPEDGVFIHAQVPIASDVTLTKLMWLKRLIHNLAKAVWFVGIKEFILISF